MRRSGLVAAALGALLLGACGHTTAAAPPATDTSPTKPSRPHHISRATAINQCQDIAGQQGLNSIIPNSMWVSMGTTTDGALDYFVHGHYSDSSGSSTTGYWSFGCGIALGGKPLWFATTFGHTDL